VRIVPPMAAVANAIHDAVGKVVEAIKANEANGA